MSDTRTPRFTPGPWRVDAVFAIPSVIAACYPKGSTCVAVVYDEEPRIMARIPPADAQPQTLANAHLIAAAPELYAALKWLTSICAGVSKDGSADISQQEWNECNEHCRAALAKAEGR